MSYSSMMITNKEFFQQACRWKDCASTKTAAEWWAAFQEVIIREIFYNGSCRVPGLGKFIAEERKSSYVKQKDANGKEINYFVPARTVPVFTPEDDFINDINMQGVTKAYRKRLRNKGLIQRDFERELRAEALNATAAVEEMAELRKAKSKEDLQKLLESKRVKNQAAIERNEGRKHAKVPVIQMDLDGNEIASFDSIRQAEAMTGIDKTHISCACSGLYGRKTAGGYKWRYANKEEREELENDELNESEACDTES